MEHSIFATELCFEMKKGSNLRAELAELVLKHPVTSSPQAKWELYKEAVERMLPELPLLFMGCWDFFDDDAKARADYDMWCNGMITEEGARKGPSGNWSAGGDVRYMTFTMAFLIVRGEGSERALSRVCDIPKDDLWKRETFAKILRGVRTLSFSSVKSDVIYVIPGESTWGLTAEDLADPKFHYLRPVT